MSKPKFPTTLFKDGTDREDTIVVADAEERDKAAKVGYFPYDEKPVVEAKPKKATK